jgi:hypothetical protein
LALLSKILIDLLSSLWHSSFNKGDKEMKLKHKTLYFLPSLLQQYKDFANQKGVYEIIINGEIHRKEIDQDGNINIIWIMKNVIGYKKNNHKIIELKQMPVAIFN